MKIKIPLIYFYIKSIIFFFSIFTLQVNAETKIIAKSGDTLFKLSRQHGVHLKELMYKNNINDANKIIEGEVIVIPLKDNKGENLIHVVIEGDSLYKIARDYNISLEDVIQLNNLSNDSKLEINQTIILPKGALNKKLISKEDLNSTIKKVFYHQTSKKEDLSKIATIHNIPSEELITLNKLNDPTNIKPNIKLKLRENKSSKWLKYGSIMISWSDWRYFDSNYITQAKTKNNKSFYIALSCKKRTLNNTLNNSYWTSWYFPELDFEYKLITDFCDQKFKI